MGIFDDIVKGGSIFVDPIALDYDYQPKLVPYREEQQHYIANCIKPLFQNRTGRNLMIAGKSGIGKTVCVRHVLMELEQSTEKIKSVYINCWKHDSAYKIALEICNQLDFRFVQNRDTSELFREVARILNKGAAVIVLDEVDKVEKADVVYTLLEDIFKKALVLITNEKGWASTLDNRIRSRLNAEVLEFRPYNFEQTRGILKMRMEHAFAPNSFDKGAFEMIAKRAFDLEDIRSGLYLLKEAADIAEAKSLRKVEMHHAEEAVKKLKDFVIKSTSTLDDVENRILEMLKKGGRTTTTELYQTYATSGGKQSYSNFHKKIKNLEKGRFIFLKEINEGASKVTFVEYGDKKLSEF